MKGRKPTPAELKMARGNPGRRDLEVVVVAGREQPKMPVGLPPRAKTVWKQLVTDLSASGVLDKADWPLLEVAAITICRMREAREVLTREGLFIEGQRGPTKHPAYMIERECGMEVRQLLDHLGVGPSGRARLGLAKKVRKDMVAEMNDRVGERGLQVVKGGRK